MYQRLLSNHLSRSRPFCLLGARGVGKTTLIREFAGKFSNHIHLDLETTVDRAIFNFDASAGETLKAISFLKGKELRGSGTLIVLDEPAGCPEALRWIRLLTEQTKSGKPDPHMPFLVAVSSVFSKEINLLTDRLTGTMKACYLYPFSFEEFLPVMADPAALEAFAEVPVPLYAYEKLLNYFHLYSLIGGMPEITSEYAANRHLAALKNIYERIEERFIQGLPDVTQGTKSRELATEVLQNTYPFAATRISFNRFGNLEKGSREIGMAFKSLENAFFLRMVYPAISTVLPQVPDTSRFPRLQMLDTGLVNYFSGIQKPLFQSHDMNAIFEGQIARQVVGQEILATADAQTAHFPPERSFEQGKLPMGGIPVLNFWTRGKAQSTAEVDFVIPFNDLLIPVVVRSGEPGRLRSLHQFIDASPHNFAVRLYAGKLAVQQTQTLLGKKFFLLNLPYFLAGKISEHLKGFIRLANG
ncbi:MAG: AAA family ATPase [Bacteroidota bacterium]